MSKMNWPPENTIKYTFNEELTFEIPLESGGKKMSKEAEGRDRSEK